MARYRGGLMEDVHRNLYLPDLLFILEKYNFLHWGKRKKYIRQFVSKLFDLLKPSIFVFCRKTVKLST